MRLAELQQTFIDYLIKGDQEVMQYVTDQGKVDVITRLHIYSNAYQQRLRETIDSDHPMLGVYLGDDLFDQMVEGYIMHHPSNTHSLRYFADQLPTFLQTSPYSDHLHIAELARFERRLLDVFDAPTTEAATLEHLHTLSSDSWPIMTLRFHPSVHVFECRWNSIEIWQALKQEQVPPEAQPQTGCSWLLWRNQARLSEFTSLSQSQQAFLNAALQGKNFAEMCETLLQFSDEQEVSQLALETLTQWIKAGVVIQLLID